MFENLSIVSISVLITAIITSFITYKVVMKKIREGDVKSDVRIGLEREIELWKKTDEYKELQNIKYLKGYEDGKNDSLIKYKESSEYKSIIEHEYLKGFDDGKKDEHLNYKTSGEYEAILKNEFYKGKKEGFEEALKEYKESPEYQKVIENEFRRGKENGQKEELAKFSIKYDTWNDYNDGFFKQHYIDGYNMQLFYNNLPIGVPTSRVLERKKKFKEENLKYLVEKLKSAVEYYIQSSTGFGITTQLTTREPKKIESDIKV